MQYVALSLVCAALVLGSPLPTARDASASPGYVNLPVVQDNDTYLVSLELGTPGQTQQLQLDTGSADLWAFSHAYKGANSTFDEEASSSFHTSVEGGLDITYGWGTVSGDIVIDDVGVLDYKLPASTFGLAKSVTRPDLLRHGILGILSENAATIQGSRGFPYALRDHGFTARIAYSIFLTNSPLLNGQITFGGIDTAKYEGKLQRVPWSTKGLPTIDIEFFGPTVTALLDTGNPNFLVSNSSFEAALAQIQKYIPTLQGDGKDFNWVRSRSEIPDEALPFAINNVTYGLPLSSLFQFDGDVWRLYLLSTGYDAAVADLGDPFFRAFYVVYDLESEELAFAPSRNTDESEIVAIPTAGVPVEYFS